MNRFKLFCNSKNKLFYIFILFFSIFFLLGMYFVTNITFEENMLLGADNHRALGDFTKFNYYHYRVSVHPIYVLLIQPLTSILTGFTQNPNVSLLLLESLLGALNIVLLSNIMEMTSISPSINTLLTILYGFSFSMLIFSSIPETFVFSSFFLLLFWYYSLLITDEKNIDKPLSKTEFITISLFGVINFGLIVTNIVVYLIITTFILIKKGYTNKKTILYLVSFGGIPVFITCIISVVQKLTWESATPFFITIIRGILHPNNYEELQYTSFSVSISKITAYIQELTFYPYISSALYKDNNTGIEKYYPILFGKYNLLISILLMALSFLIFISTFAILFSGLKRKNVFQIAISFTMLYNLILHFFYGSHEAFIYSMQYIYLEILLLGFAISKINRPLLLNIIKCFLCLVIIIEIFNNMLRYNDMAYLVKTHFSYNYSNIKAFCVGLFLLIFLLFIALVLRYIITTYTRLKLIENKVKIDYFIIILISVDIIWSVTSIISKLSIQ